MEATTYPIGKSKKIFLWDLPGYGTESLEGGLHGENYIRKYRLPW